MTKENSEMKKQLNKVVKEMSKLSRDYISNSLKMKECMDIVNSSLAELEYKQEILKEMLDELGRLRENYSSYIITTYSVQKLCEKLIK